MSTYSTALLPATDKYHIITSPAGWAIHRNGVATNSEVAFFPKGEYTAKLVEAICALLNKQGK